MAVTVAFDEVAASPTEQWGADAGQRFSATRVLRCPWGQRKQLSQELLGINVGPTVAPQSYPNYTPAKVVNVGVEPEGELIQNDSGLPSYEFAILTVQYSDTVQDSNGVLIEESLQPSAEFLTGGTQSLYWDASQNEQVDIKDAPGIILRSMEWNVTMHNVASISTNLISKVGHVNHATVTSLTLGVSFPAETLMYLGASPNRTITDTGGQLFTVGLAFSARRFSWNKFYRAGSANPQHMFDSGGSVNRYYPTANFVNDLNLIVSSP